MTINAKLQQLFALVLFAVLLVGNVVLTRQVFTQPFPGHNDFMTPWEGTRAFWLDGLNPYGEEATERIQLRIFGGPPSPEEDPGYFSYPFYATYLIAPLGNLEYSWASAIWMVVLEVCMIVSLLVIVNLFKLELSPLGITVMILWTLFFYPSARGLILGQYSHFVFMLEMLTLWALFRGNDDIAGVALGISTLKPQMGYLLVPFLLLWAVRQRRFRFVGVFSATFLVLMGTAFAIYPDWMGEWLHRLSVYSSYTLGSPVFLLTQEYLGLGDIGEWIVTGLLYALVLWSWWMVLVKRKNERFMWTLMWTLNITHIVAPRTASPHFVVFIIAVVFFAATWRKLYTKGSQWRINLMLFVLFLLPWIHFMATVGGVNGEQEDPSTHLILPLVMLLIMWLSRQLWWSHAPRIDNLDMEHSSPQLSETKA